MTGRASVWQPAAVSREEYAARAVSPGYARALAANPPGAASNPNLLAFGNSGGLLRNGVCWWHSRFTRAALYLVYFEPSKPKPDARTARKAIRSLMNADRVVEIPGYSCLRDFSADYAKEIQKILERRQISDGVLRFAWIDGLSGSHRVSGRRLGALLDGIHAETSRAGLAYVKLQIHGIDAHSLLVTEMEPLGGGGYRCRYLDSNWPLERVWEYTPGPYPESAVTGMPGVPYLQRTGELRRIRAKVAEFADRAGRGNA